MNSRQKYILIFISSITLILSVYYILLKNEWFQGQMYPSQDQLSHIIFNLRLNAVLTAIFCGIGLSISGLFLQTLFYNPLSSPYTLGISPISSLFTSVYILFYSFFQTKISLECSTYWVFLIQILVSFSGAFITLYLIQKFNQSVSNKSLIILVGIMLGTLAGAFQQILEIFMTEHQLKTNLYWNLGTFELVDSYLVYFLLISILLGSVLLYFKSQDSNKYLLGETYARTLGLDINDYQRNIILYTSLIISVLTTVCGPIGFIGLISPHMAKKIIKTNKHEILSLFTMVIGAFVCVLCLIVSQIGFFNTIIPINTVAALIGVPLTIYLLIKNFRY